MRLAGMPCAEPEVARHVVGPELVVALVDRRPDALGVEPPGARRELVGHLDRARLEVVAEREVAHHLEEREVAVGRADDVDVDGAEAALDRGQPRGGRRRLAEEVRLERLHAGGREQHRLVERRGHERGRGHGEVPALDEEVREAAADLVGRRHGAHSSPILRGGAETRRARRIRCKSALSCPRPRCRCRGCEAARDPGGREAAGRPGAAAAAPRLRARRGRSGARAARLPLLPRLRARARRLLHAPLHARGRARRVRDARRRHRHRDRRGHARALHLDRAGGARAHVRARPASGRSS